MKAIAAVLLIVAACGSPADYRDTTTLPPLSIDARMPASPSTIAPATASSAAVRLMIFEQETATLPPPLETAPIGLDDCAEMSWYRQRAGLPAVFDRLGWRESNCRNEEGVHTFCCWGWWQLWISLHLDDRRLVDAYHACGVYSSRDVDSDTPADKRRQACAAAALYAVEGLQPWQR